MALGDRIVRSSTLAKCSDWHRFGEGGWLSQSKAGVCQAGTKRGQRVRSYHRNDSNDCHCYHHQSLFQSQPFTQCLICIGLFLLIRIGILQLLFVFVKLFFNIHRMCFRTYKIIPNLSPFAKLLRLLPQKKNSPTISSQIFLYSCHTLQNE